jgi:hypothetical protein
MHGERQDRVVDLARSNLISSAAMIRASIDPSLEWFGDFEQWRSHLMTCVVN